MIKINKNDGKTVSFDLENDTDYHDVVDLLNDENMVQTITGVSSLHHTFWHALVRPKKFRTVKYTVEKVYNTKGGIKKATGEKIICQADDIQLTILVYYNVRPKMTRIEIKKIGKMRFRPKRGHDVTDNKKTT